jgi:hypothetical protein
MKMSETKVNNEAPLCAGFLQCVPLHRQRCVRVILCFGLYLSCNLISPRRRWEDGIRMDLREIGLGGGGVDWIRLAQDRDRWRAVVSPVMNLRVLALRS